MSSMETLTGDIVEHKKEEFVPAVRETVTTLPSIESDDSNREREIISEGTIAIAPERAHEGPQTYEETCALFEKTRGMERTRIISDIHLNPNNEEVLKLWDEYRISKSTGKRPSKSILETVQIQQKDGLPMVEAFLEDCKEHKKALGKVIVGGDIIDSSMRDMFNDSGFREYLEQPPIKQNLERINQERVSRGEKPIEIYDPNHTIVWAIKRLRENLNPETPIEIILGNHDVPRLKDEEITIVEGWKIERGYLRKKNSASGKFEEVKTWDDVPADIIEYLEENALSPLDYNPDEALYDRREAEKIKEMIENDKNGVPNTKVLTIDFRKPVETTLADGRKAIVSHAPVVKDGGNLGKVVDKENLTGKFIIPADDEVAIACDQHSTDYIKGLNLHPDAKPGTPLDYIQLGAAAATSRHKENKTSFVDITNKVVETNGEVNKESGKVYVLGRRVADNKIEPIKLHAADYVRPVVASAA